MKKRYEVWMGERNYRGELSWKECVAIFYGTSRAVEYLRFCYEQTFEEESIEYWMESK